MQDPKSFDTPAPKRRIPRRTRRLAAALLAVALAGVGAASWARGGHHCSAHGLGGDAMMFPAGPERVARLVDRWLEGVKLTEAQRLQVRQIAQAAAADLKAQREAGRGLREKAALLFVAPEVDAAQVEALRQQMLARHDASSRRVTQALLEIGKVLGPEQRLQLAERLKRHGERRHGHPAPAAGAEPLG